MNTSLSDAVEKVIEASNKMEKISEGILGSGLQQNDGLKKYFADMERSAHQAYIQKTAEGTATAIFEEIKTFEKNLPPEHALAISIGNAGQVILDEVCSRGPLLVVFRGRDRNGNVVIIQHLSQISISLAAIKVNEPRKPIGFNSINDLKPQA